MSPIVKNQNIPSEFSGAYIMSLQPEAVLIPNSLYGIAIYGVNKYGVHPRGYVKKRNPFRLPASSGGSEL